MLYEEYEQYKYKYYLAQESYNELLTIKEKLFAMTQPSSVEYEKDKVMGGSGQNAFDRYLILKEKEKIDEKLKEAKSILNDRRILLTTKREELKSSEHIYDKIYYLRFVKKVKINKIAAAVGYSEASVYRILRRINQRIKA